MTFAESQKLSWSIHNTAAGKAKQAGACWQCCAEAGCRATDAAGLGMRPEPRPVRIIHPECARRIARGIPANTVRPQRRDL